MSIARPHLSRSILVAALLTAPLTASAGGTRQRTIADYEALDEGEATGAAIESSGRVTVGMTSSRAIVEGSKSVFSCVADGSKAWFGTADEAAIVRVTPGRGAPKVERLAALPGVVVSAIAKLPNGDLVVATLPGGELSRVDAKGTVRSFAKLDVEQVWALAVVGGRLLAATGPKGELHSLALDGSGDKVVLDVDDKDLLSLLVVDGRVLVGTAPNAKIYEVVSDATAGRLIHDFEGDEVRAMALSGSNLVAAVNDFEERDVNSVQNLTRQLARASLTGDAPASQSAAASEPRANAKLYRVELGRQGGVDLNRAMEAPWDVWLDKSKQYFTSVVATDERGTVLVATSKDAKIYRVKGRREVATVADLEERRATALCRLDGQRVLAAAADGAAVYALTQTPATSARWLSKPYDSGQPADYGRVTVRAGGKVSLRVRTGPTDDPDASWSAWKKITLSRSGGALVGDLGVGRRRYVQFEVALEDVNAELRSLSYFYAPENLAPLVKSVEVSPPKADADADDEPKPNARVKWSAEARDDDELLFRVRMRAEGGDDGQWFRVHDDELISKRELDVDLTTVPDGVYEIEVLATDEATNGGERARRDELRSLPFVVDRGRPRIEGAQVQGGRLVGTAVDDQSRIMSVSYSIDGGAFRTASAGDGLYDGPRERFEITLPALEKGTHRVVLRARDEVGNLGTAAILVTR